MPSKPTERAGEGWTRVGWIRRVPGRLPPDDCAFAETLRQTGYTTEEAAEADGWVPVFCRSDDYPWSER